MLASAQSAPAAPPPSPGLFVRIAGGEAPSIVAALAKVGEPQELALAPGESVRDRITARCGLVDLAYVGAFLEENRAARPELAAADLDLPAAGGIFIFPFCLPAHSVPYSVRRGDSIGDIFSRLAVPLDASGLQKALSEGEPLSNASLSRLQTIEMLSDARALTSNNSGFAATENARRFVAENPGIDPLSLQVGDKINIAIGQREGFVPLREGFDAALARTLLAKAAQRDKAGASGVAFKKAQPASLIGEVKDLREGSCDMVAGRDWPFSIPEFKAALEANSRRRGTTALRPVTVLLVDTGYDPRMLGKAIPDASLGEVESFVSGAIARIGVNTAEQNNDPDAPEGLASSLHGSEVAATLLGGSWLEGERANIPLPKVAFASLARYSGLTREFYLDPEGVGRAYTQAWSTNPRIQIINASVSVDPPYQSFKNYLKDETVLLVAAAGNVPGAPQAFDKTALTWPGAMGGNPLHANPGLVISVGAHNPNGDALYFSRLGEMQVDLLAPGCRIPTFSYADDRITQKDRNGTSFAAPIVSLAASLLAGEALSNHAIKNRLITTVDVDGNLAEAVWSSGRLNVARALRVYEDYVAADRVTYTDADGTNPREVKGPVEIWGLAHQEEVRLCGSWIPKGDLRMLARMVRPDTPEEWKAWRYVPSYTAISSLLCPTSYPVKGSLKFEIEGGTATVDIKDVRMFAARARN